MEFDLIELLIFLLIWISIVIGWLLQYYGIFDFWLNLFDVKMKCVWDMVDDCGYCLGVLGYFVIWLFCKSSGFLVLGWMVQGMEIVLEDFEFLKCIEFCGKEIGVVVFLLFVGLVLQSFYYGMILGILNCVVVGFGC